MNTRTLYALVAACVVVLALVPACANARVAVTAVPASCDGTANTIPIHTDAPVFISEVPNGKRYLGGSGNDTFHIVHLWGTPYEQGYAQGKLLKEEVKKIHAEFVTYIEEQIEGILTKLPKWVAVLLGQCGADIVAPYLLELTYNWTKPFTPKRYIDEMQGISDASGISFSDIVNLNMFPELTKAACTIVGATNAATPTKKLTHLRGLDFPPECPLKDQAQVTVYHGNVSGESTVAAFGWSAMVGSLTGISNVSIGIGEKVWERHQKLEGVEGQPWMFILRDVLMTKDMTEALATIQKANRTCAIHVGIGDSTTNTFRGVEMAQKQVNVYNWSSLEWAGHPVIQDVFYWNKHEQPSHAPCLGELLQDNHGNLSAEVMATTVSAIGATGDMHSVTFDYEKQTAYFSNARKTHVTSGDLNAYNRQFTKLDLAKLFGEQPPQ